MRKDVMVRSFEGDVMITNVPFSTSNKKVVEVARRALIDALGKNFDHLCNVEYLSPAKMEEYLINYQDDDYISVDFEDYRKYVKSKRAKRC